MDEKERYRTNREARHDVTANRDESTRRRPEVIARFVNALLYANTRSPRRERKEQDGGPRPER